MFSKALIKKYAPLLLAVLSAAVWTCYFGWGSGSNAIEENFLALFQALSNQHSRELSTAWIMTTVLVLVEVGAARLERLPMLILCALSLFLLSYGMVGELCSMLQGAFTCSGAVIAAACLLHRRNRDVRIPEPLGHSFRRDQGTDSGSIWALIPEHLGTDSGALGH